MKEFKDLQDLIIKAEEIALRIEDANESHERGRLELNRVTNDTRQAVIRMNNVIEMLPKIEENVDSLVTMMNSIDVEKIQNDINDSFAGINIEFDWVEINKNMNLRLIKLFEEIHLDRFASHLNSHINGYQAQCNKIDTSVNKLQTIGNMVEKLEKYIQDYENVLRDLKPKENYLQWALLTSLGAITGSMATYFIIQF